MALQVKICGIVTPDELAAALAGDCTMAGFDFRERSARVITPPQGALLTNKTTTTVKTVGIFADPKPAVIEQIIAGGADLDLIQLAGAETPTDIQRLRAQCGLPVIKTLRLADIPAGEDMNAAARPYEKICESLVIETTGSGETARARLAGFKPSKPWFLAAADVDDRALAAQCATLKPAGVSWSLKDSPAGEAGAQSIEAFFATLNQVTGC